MCLLEIRQFSEAKPFPCKIVTQMDGWERKVEQVCTKSMMKYMEIADSESQYGHYRS